MNQWEVVAAVLGATLFPCLGVCLLAGIADALAAFELASVLLATLLLALAEGIQRQPFVDLALVFAVLSLVGAMVVARLLERDL